MRKIIILLVSIVGISLIFISSANAANVNGITIYTIRPDDSSTNVVEFQGLDYNLYHGLNVFDGGTKINFPLDWYNIAYENLVPDGEIYYFMFSTGYGVYLNLPELNTLLHNVSFMTIFNNTGQVVYTFYDNFNKIILSQQMLSFDSPSFYSPVYDAQIHYENGYNDGYNAGNSELYDMGYDDGWWTGLDLGYDNGYNTGINENITTGGFSLLLSSGFSAVGTIMAIELIPNVSIGSLVAIPIVFGVIMFIIGRKKE